MIDKKLTILGIDDCEDDLILLRRYLEDVPGIVVNLVEARSAEAGLKALKDPAIEVIFLDYLLGPQNGMEVLEQIRANGDVRSIIVMTGMTSAPLAVSLTHAGADDYIDKNTMNAELLRRAIDNAQAQQRRRETYAENKRLLKELQDANRLLEQKNARLAELYDTAHRFVDNVSHEFRTPLAVIKEYASLIRDGILGQINPEQGEFLDVIGNRVEDLTLMVDDMLDISRSGAGMLHVVRRPCRIEDVITHALPNLDRRAAIKKVKLETQVAAGLSGIYCDPEKIGRTIINLAVNALKFVSEGGKVQIWARDDLAQGQVLVGVTDDGPGISDENRQMIFERFKQVDADIRQSTKGFGLGLNIVKELVDINFGQVTIDSELGCGSTFSFSVPAAEPTQVVHHYLRWLEQVEQTAAVSLVWAKAATAPDPEAVGVQIEAGEAGEFLRKLIRPRDLIFAPATGIWLLVVQCEPGELAHLFNGFEDKRLESNRNRPKGQLPVINYKTDGTWHVPRENNAFLDRFRWTIATKESSCG